ncbi:NADAR family protein [Aggregatibacter actinomycetemcomitans]|uniref:NADAR family protein n=1 Tax=Aggregatibacter actinomycetemcomitans TaxID=714 RepID=UPI00197B2A93|nr:NADAR family protein [Aggregatibacter actinomycetemcomitans]
MGRFQILLLMVFFVDNKYWRTVEHYFQAKKFLNIELQESIRNTISPMKAALEGRSRNNPIRTDWELVKDDIMRFAVLEKFKQNPDIAQLLISTGEKLIFEHTANDFYWGDGLGKGKNMLGIILMETRDIIRSIYI